MNKKLFGAAIAGAGAIALGIEVAVHGYLDVMYKETIPAGLIKRVANKANEDSMAEIIEYNKKEVEWINTKTVEELDMTSKRGYNLKGYLLMAEEKSDIFVVFAHGYRADHLGDPANFERHYHEDLKYNFLSVDHVTAGKSEGEFLGFDYFESEDLLDWCRVLTDRFGEDIKIILHGVSMGGATVCKCADKVPSQVKMIISDCAYTGANQQFTAVVGSIGIKKSAPVFLKVFNEMNKMLAGFDLKETDVIDNVKNSKVPMLFVHGGADDFVPTDMVYVLHDACQNDKELLIIDGAKHAESIRVDQKLYHETMDNFIKERI